MSRPIELTRDEAEALVDIIEEAIKSGRTVDRRMEWVRDDLLKI